MAIWKARLPHKRGAGRVLSNCKRDEVHCTNVDARLKIAVFLQSCDGPGTAPSPGTARMRIAYRTYHPEPIRFTRQAGIVGGTLSRYNPKEELELATGRTAGRPYLEAIVPDAIDVVRGPNGAQVKMEMHSISTKPIHLEKFFSLVFPESERSKCPCC